MNQCLWVKAFTFSYSYSWLAVYCTHIWYWYIWVCRN